MDHDEIDDAAAGVVVAAIVILSGIITGMAALVALVVWLS